jgi:hypothetical protein
VGAPLLVVTPWYPVEGPGSPLDAAVAATVTAAAHAGADVTVVHLVPPDAPVPPAPEPGAVTVRRVVVDAPLTPGDPAAVDAVVAALAESAAELLGTATVVHAHGAVPVAAAVARLAPESARLVVGEHLPSALPLLAAGASGTADPALVAAWRAVVGRADVVLAPSEHLARRLADCLGPAAPARPAARFEVLPYPAATAPAAPPGPAGEGEALPATRWLLVGPPATGEVVVRALAADALAGAPTTLAVVGADGDDAGTGLAALAARLGIGQRLVRVDPEAVPALLAGSVGGHCAVDLVIGPDPLAAADPVLTAAFAAGVPAVLARDAGPEFLVDEVAATGAVRLIRPGTGVLALLEAVADLRRAALESAAAGGPAPAALLAPWRISPGATAGHLLRHYGTSVAPEPTDTRAGRWPRVLLVDLDGGHRTEIGGLARWLVGIGGEPVVVTAGGPPPSTGLTGAVSVDLRPVQRAVAGRRVQGVRRRLPGVARPAFDGAVAGYRRLRRPPTLVDAALHGPLAAGTGPAPHVDAAVAAEPAGAELARRWAGVADVLEPDADQLIAHLTAASAGAPARTEGT